MFNESALDEKVLQFDGWNTQKLVLAVKQLDGKLFLDVRKWQELGEKGFKRASDRGIMLNVEHWPTVLKTIQELLNSQTEQRS